MKSKKQNVLKGSKVSLGHKIIIFPLLCVFFCTIISFTPIKIKSITKSGIDIIYEINVTAPPEAGIKITATYTNITTLPYRLEISPILSVLKDIQFSSSDGKILSWKEISDRTIEVNATGDSVVANYSMDLTKTDQQTRVSVIGGGLNGYEAFLLPNYQEVNSIKVKITVPEPWTVVSAYPKEDEWFAIKPYTFEDLASEIHGSAWAFGNIDFDYTKTYDDGFEIRVVGFKYSAYGHWDVYLGNTPLEEALECADFYHETYAKIKEIYGEFPIPKTVLIGSQFWQPGNTYLRQSLLGWYRYEAIPHHMLHPFFPTRINFNGYFDSHSFSLTEGYPTYSEGFMTAEITNDPMWRGMLYERKFHYLRGNKFNTMEQFSRCYVLGFIATFLMDKEIKKQTNNQKGIDDLMVAIWKKYNEPNPVWVSDEQVLETLKEITGNDWHSFYEKNIKDTSNLDTDSLDELKDDFRLFLKAIADYWYNGNQSMYFVGQEIVAAAGNFDQNVRMQNPTNISPHIGDFALYARKYKDVTQSDLTEKDIEEILHQITGKDHSDFFEFYRSQGFEVDPKEITEFAKTFTYTNAQIDNAIKLIPNTFPIGQSTTVIGEIVDQDFANSTEFLLQVQVYDHPKGLSNIQELITGKGVSYQDSGEFPECINYFFKLPKIEIDGKTYTFFTINLPEDAGIIRFSFWAKTFEEPTYDDWYGGFVGTKKVSFQSESTFRFKPNNFNIVDNTPPVFSITEPKSSEVVTESKTIYIRGLVEPEATVLINDQPATISDTSFEFSYYVDLIPGDNAIEVEVSDKAGNTVTKTISVTYKKTDTTPPEITVSSPSNYSIVNDDFITVSGTATDDSGIDKVTVNGSEVSVASNGTFSKTVNLTEGINTITIIATDKEGNTATKTITVTYTLPAQETVITLQPDNSYMTVNGVSQEIDPGRGTTPVIIPEWSRTVVPIRAIVEALGGTISWDGTERKVTINFKETVIELWIDNPKARVNGTEIYIDDKNHNVKPIIINDRTMLPLRFVAESLGCNVGWDPDTRTITITYGG